MLFEKGRYRQNDKGGRWRRTEGEGEKKKTKYRNGGIIW